MRKKVKVPKKKEEKSECEQRIDSANRELKRLTETAYECRVNFIRSFTAVEKYKETIIKWLMMFAGREIMDYCTLTEHISIPRLEAMKSILWIRRNGGSLSPRTSVRR